MASDDKILGGLDKLTQSAENGSRPGRRKVLKAGALLVPTIVTLHGMPAWAQTDYTMTAYRYGVNKGLCRNPKFNPNADPNSQAGREFVECKRRGRDHDYDSGTQESGPTVDF